MDLCTLVLRLRPHYHLLSVSLFCWRGKKSRKKLTPIYSYGFFLAFILHQFASVPSGFSFVDWSLNGTHTTVVSDQKNENLTKGPFRFFFTFKSMENGASVCIRFSLLFARSVFLLHMLRPYGFFNGSVQTDANWCKFFIAVCFSFWTDLLLFAWINNYFIIHHNLGCCDCIFFMYKWSHNTAVCMCPKCVKKIALIYILSCCILYTYQLINFCLLLLETNNGFPQDLTAQLSSVQFIWTLRNPAKFSI